jgi:hypothetical protein
MIKESMEVLAENPRFSKAYEESKEAQTVFLKNQPDLLKPARCPNEVEIIEPIRGA